MTLKIQVSDDVIFVGLNFCWRGSSRLLGNQRLGSAYHLAGAGIEGKIPIHEEELRNLLGSPTFQKASTSATK